MCAGDTVYKGGASSYRRPIDPASFNNTVSEMAATPPSTTDQMMGRMPVVKRSMGIKDILVEADSINSMAGKLDCNSERRTYNNNSKQHCTMKNNTSGAMIPQQAQTHKSPQSMKKLTQAENKAFGSTINSASSKGVVGEPIKQEPEPNTINLSINFRAKA